MLSQEARDFLRLAEGVDPVLLLRATHPDGRARRGFQWPTSIDTGGQGVEAPDWDPAPSPGHGLHGALWGCGDASHFEGDKWQGLWSVVATNPEHVVDLGGNVKTPRVWVVHVGDRASATQYLYVHAPATAKILGLILAVGDDATVGAGDRARVLAGVNATLTSGTHSTLIAGEGSTLTAGYLSCLTAGDYSTLTAGARSTLTAGVQSQLSAGVSSTLTAGEDSTLAAQADSKLTAGNRSILSAGYRSTLTAGHSSTLSAGYHSTLLAGIGSTLSAGTGSTLIWEYLADDEIHYRYRTFYVGEDGCLPNVAYVMRAGKLVEAD